MSVRVGQGMALSQPPLSANDALPRCRHTLFSGKSVKLWRQHPTFDAE